MSGAAQKFREIINRTPRPRRTAATAECFARTLCSSALAPAPTPQLKGALDIEAWAEQYVCSTDLSHKLAPPEPPKAFRKTASTLRLDAPGRPAELRAARRGERTPKQEALDEPHYRARTLHAFLHHELQAAELMCWAILAFPEAEPEFRRGLLGICLDEIRHMNLYVEHIRALGSQVGDEVGAQIQERIAAEEVAHVGFATRWFARWTGGCDFDEWSRLLPPPLSPWVMHGRPIADDARRRAGMPEAFLRDLAAFVPEPKGRMP